jgi:hypothetical protein
LLNHRAYLVCWAHAYLVCWAHGAFLVRWAQASCIVQGSFSEDAAVALEARFTISRVLQLWLLHRHPISLFQSILRPGRSSSGAGSAAKLENVVEAGGAPPLVSAMDDDRLEAPTRAIDWLSPRGMAVVIALLGDILPPAWPPASMAGHKRAPEVRPPFRDPWTSGFHSSIDSCRACSTIEGYHPPILKAATHLFCASACHN